MIAQMLEVHPRTIRNWIKASTKTSKKIGRPRYTLLQRKIALILVARELKKQGYPGSPAIAKALDKKVPLRLIVEYVKKLKMRRRTRLLAEREQKRTNTEVLVRDAIWTQDGTHLGRMNRKAIESQVIKDRASLKTIAIQTGESANGKEVVSLLASIKKNRSLPLVWMTDNGSAYCNEEVTKFLQNEKVIHLRSLPRTPEHNGASEIGMKEMKSWTVLNRLMRAMLSL